jgi:glutamate decarboxylase
MSLHSIVSLQFPTSYTPSPVLSNIILTLGIDQFVRLGKVGYREIIKNIMQVAVDLTHTLRDLGFLILSKAGYRGIPVVAFRMNPLDGYDFDEFDLASELGKMKWLVPAYHMADGARNIKLLRVVCRVDFTPNLRDEFVRDLILAMNILKVRG